MASDSRTQPINIGSIHYCEGNDQNSSQSVESSHDGPTTSHFYGSPDVMPECVSQSSISAVAATFMSGTSSAQLQNQDIGASRSTIGTSATRRPQRPRLGNRTVSPPLDVSSAARSREYVTTRLSNHLKQLVHRNPTAPAHEWSLFTQMMENEGQIPSSPTSYHGSHHKLTTPPNYSPLSRRDICADREDTGVYQPLESLEPAIDAPEYDSECDYDVDTPDGNVATATMEIPGVSSIENVADDTGRRWFSLRKLPTLTLVQRNVLKCAIAYLVSSLFTFSPTLSDFIGDLTSYGHGSNGPSPSAHMVATIAVYFNPAKTVGAMIEADLYCVLGLLYSIFVCGASMSMFWWLEHKPGWEWLGDIMALIWLGVSMSIVAWMKVWMASPSFNTACSMTAIVIFVVIVKEGGFQTLMGVSTIIICGSTISNLICYLIWPQTATSNLQIDMAKTLDSFSTVLSMLTSGFLLENETYIKKTGLEKVQKAVDNHQSSFTSLKRNLAEAKQEWMDSGDDSSVLGIRASLRVTRRKKAYEDAVDSLNRLAQHLNGLRSGTRLQYELTRLGAHKGKGKGIHITEPHIPEDEGALLKTAAEMFGALVDEVGPPLKALSVEFMPAIFLLDKPTFLQMVCTTTLNRLREAFLRSRVPKDHDQDSIQPPAFEDFIDAIEKALVRFDSTSNHALLRLYRRSDFSQPSVVFPQPNPDPDTSYATGVEEKNVLLASQDHEQVFVVYFFIFTLQEFSRELVSLVDAMERIYECEQRRIRRWYWIARAIKGLLTKPFNYCHSRRKESILRRRTGLKKRLSSYLIPEHRIVHPGFPKIRPHAPNTRQTPSRKDLSFVGRFKQRLWSIGARMKERDIKFALKAGMATALLAAPAFHDATRPIFVQYWGDWALISFFVVISPTIGATNYLSLQRVVGTLFGAAVAAGVYSAFPDNGVILPIFGFFFSLPCFYIAVSQPQYISASRFVLLTYNLTCLYCYNLRQKDVSVFDVALHRALAVTGGVLWAAFISRFWWPSEARRELSRALGEFCLNLGWLYTHLVASNTYSPEARPDGGSTADSEMTAMLQVGQDIKMRGSIQEFLAMELHLQIKLIELQGLLAQTVHEPRLKGPFPVQLYRNILTSLQTILDRLHSMRCVTTKEECTQSVRQDFIIPVNKERREMVGNIILGFSTLASAFRSKAPLPPYLPPVEKTRQNLVDAIRNLDIVKNRKVKGSRQLLFFAYALTMKGVTQELEKLGKTCQEAFGVIGQTPEEFEALFLTLEEMQARTA